MWWNTVLLSLENSITKAANLCKLMLSILSYWGGQKINFLILNAYKKCHENKQRFHLPFITRLQWRTFIIHSLPCSAIHFNSSLAKLKKENFQSPVHSAVYTTIFYLAIFAIFFLLSSLLSISLFTLSIYPSLPFPFFLVHHFCAKCIFQYFHFAEFSSSSSCEILLRVVVQHLSCVNKKLSQFQFFHLSFQHEHEPPFHSIPFLALSVCMFIKHKIRGRNSHLKASYASCIEQRKLIFIQNRLLMIIFDIEFHWVYCVDKWLYGCFCVSPWHLNNHWSENMAWLNFMI